MALLGYGGASDPSTRRENEPQASDFTLLHVTCGFHVIPMTCGANRLGETAKELELDENIWQVHSL
jgi:hypothetical protein